MAIGTRILTTPSKEATLAKPEWGMKRTCASCGARFYDLNRDPITCPKCEAVFDPDQATRLKRARTASRRRRRRNLPRRPGRAGRRKGRFGR